MSQRYKVDVYAKKEGSWQIRQYTVEAGNFEAAQHAVIDAARKEGVTHINFLRYETGTFIRSAPKV